MTEEFKDSETQPVSKTLLIAMGGPTGGGKTESAMRIARGIAGPNGTFAVIDTENKRALNKKGRYRFAHLDMQPPYSPEHFKALIERAAKDGHKAILVDSFSAEWDDEGGLHDQADSALDRMSKGNAELASKLLGLAWKEPKRAHKALMRYLRKGCDVPIIFGLRAEPKIKYIKDEKGKTQVVDAGWLPITEKLFGYDMLIYALMMAENPGVPVHLKKLEQEFEAMFPVGKQITEDSGRQLAAWAAGGKKLDANPTAATSEKAAGNTDLITPDQADALEVRCHENNIEVARLKLAAKVERLSQIKAVDLERAQKWIQAAIDNRKTAGQTA